MQVPPLTIEMCALYVPEQARMVPAGSSFYVTIGPPESTESKPEDGAKCIVHLQDPDNGMTLFPAQWDASQIAFVADVFVGVVGGNVIWATLDVRFLCFVRVPHVFRLSHPCDQCVAATLCCSMHRHRHHALMHCSGKLGSATLAHACRGSVWEARTTT
jgi:hypothetical protein